MLNSIFNKNNKLNIIKGTDIIGVVLMMFVVLPIYLSRFNKPYSFMHIGLATAVIVLIIYLCQFIIANYTYRRLNADTDIVNNNVLNVSTSLALRVCIYIVVVISVMFYGFKALSIVFMAYIINNLMCAFIPKWHMKYLSIFNPDFYGNFIAKSSDFKYRYAANMLSNILYALIPSLLLMYSIGFRALLDIKGFYFMGNKYALGVIFLSALIAVTERIKEVNQRVLIKKEESFSDYNSKLSKKTGFLGLLIIAGIFALLFYIGLPTGG